MRWTVPGASMAASASTWPPADSWTIALFPRVWPAEKLIREKGGGGGPVAYARRLPSPVGCVTVRFIATDETPTGTPHTPATAIVRTVPDASAGPFAGRRVS